MERGAGGAREWPALIKAQPDAGRGIADLGRVRSRVPTLLRQTPAMSGKKVFVSHATADRLLADALVDLLQTGCNLTTDQIFASSVQGVNIPKGLRFEEHIQGQLRDAAVVVVLVTPSYWASAFCLCELGGQWALGLTAISLLVPPQTFGDLKAVADAREAGVIDRADDLDDLRDEIKRKLGAGVATARWTAKRNTFLKVTLPPLVSTTPAATTVSADEHERLLEQVGALQEMLGECDAELRAASVRYERLKSAKTAEQVKEALQPDEDEEAALEHLRNTAQTALAALSNCVVEALFVVECGWASEVGWQPDIDGWQDAERAAQDGFLKEDNSGQGYWPNRDHPKVDRAEQAVKQLTQWEASERAIEVFVEDEDIPWDPHSRSWWQAMGLL